MGGTLSGILRDRRHERKYCIRYSIRNGVESELFATIVILFLPKKQQYYAWIYQMGGILTWLGIFSICFVASGKQIEGKPVDGSQDPMSQHRRLHLPRRISGQRIRDIAP